MGTLGPVLWILSCLLLPSSVPVNSQVINKAHNHIVCSTWGNYHYKTFDGDIFQFPGTCNYIFSSHCQNTFEDFNIQIRRSVGPGKTTLSYVVLKIEGLVIELQNGDVKVAEESVSLPYSQHGVQIQRTSVYLKVSAKIGLVFMWNEDDAAMLELQPKYMNSTCGLCGNFNGVLQDELMLNDIQLTPLQFGNLQKWNGPTEQCEDPVASAPKNCSDLIPTCSRLLSSSVFTDCALRVAVDRYIDSCVSDLCSCHFQSGVSCVCDTVAEYSRQCAHAGGKPQDWRTPYLCERRCPMNMTYQECGSPCTDTCSNQERALVCEDHCVDGCFCPEGTVYDDIDNRGCVPLSDCSCTYNNTKYKPGETYSSHCRKCTCAGGQWSCESLPCPGHCSLAGGAHISTYDGGHYNFHGDCNYIFTKDCRRNTFTVLAEMRRCGITDTETCLKSVTLSLDKGNTVITVKSSGTVLLNGIYAQIPLVTENIAVFTPSSFYLIVQSFSGIQIQVQLSPVMQLFVILDSEYQGDTCGLCGDFNNVQTDDYRSLSGALEGTAAAFANTWRSQGDCTDVKEIYENPCSLSVENERYAHQWCSLISDTNGPFGSCHTAVNPSIFEKNCMYDSCNYEKSEDSVCAAMSSYARACAIEGIALYGWRDTFCGKYTKDCPKNSTYQYSIKTCQKTCRSLSEPDPSCSVHFIPLDGCGCPKGTYLDDSGSCVPAQSCPCYYKGSVIPVGETIYDNGAMCTCQSGRLHCIGKISSLTVCPADMVYFDCSNASIGAKGVECQKTCQTLDMECFSIQCSSGCICSEGLVLNNDGICMPEEDCPCVHNGDIYHSGDTIQQDCNTCVCKGRKWQCTENDCPRTCAVYGEGHYVTFDGKRYDFNGACEYTLTQDYCASNTGNGTFRVISENIPCSSIGATCSKAIKVFLGNFELKLSEGVFEVLERDIGSEVPYHVRQMGIYLVIEAKDGLILMWDKKTSILIKLSPTFKGSVCGLCGNYDGCVPNEFTTRSLSVVVNEQEFGNSWKASPTCPDAQPVRDPCVTNPYRQPWAQKHCSIIMGPVFTKCQSKVDPTPYYEACVRDTCACDSGGDCECYCTAVAAYAAACNEAGICITWRSPEICPLFCDYYNPEGECEWHYRPCGAPCMKTCRNPRGTCMNQLPGLEGCYPKCPKERPLFDEDIMQCVAQANCGCYDDDGKRYSVGQMVPSYRNCESCICTKKGRKCQMDLRACSCFYGNIKYKYGDLIYNTTDGIGGCIIATCSFNGTISRTVYPCVSTTKAPTTTFHFDTTTLPQSLTHSTSAPESLTSASCLEEVCKWSIWYDVSCPKYGENDGDFETFENIRANGFSICKVPSQVECRAQKFPKIPVVDLDQMIQCNTSVGLVCHNHDQYSQLCFNYEIRVLCCSYMPCGESNITPTPKEMSSQPMSTIINASMTTIGSTILNTKSNMTLSTSNKPLSTYMDSSTSSATDKTTPCQKQMCTWTSWYDVYFPSSSTSDGDFETLKQIRTAGKYMCGDPQAIECRAEHFPDKHISEIGQVVTCNVTDGLICRNKDQELHFPLCYNYEVRVLCCLLEDCEQSTTHAHPTITQDIAKTSGEITVLRQEITFPTSVTSEALTEKEEEIPTTSKQMDHTGSMKTVNTGLEKTVKITDFYSTAHKTSYDHCKSECNWSQWFDVSFPNDDTYGDFETFKNIMDTGYEICERPSNIQCRTVDLPEIPLEDLQQNVDCNVSQGLVCRNEDQTASFPYCYNYEIRILCCSECVPTTGSPSSTGFLKSTPETPHEDKTTYTPIEISTLPIEMTTTLTTTAGRTDTTKEINSELTSSILKSSTETSQETESPTQIPLSMTTTKGSTEFVEVTSTSNSLSTGKMSSSEFITSSVKSATSAAVELSSKANASATINTTSKIYSKTTASFISLTAKPSLEESTSQKTISMETSSGLATTVETETGKTGSSDISSITKPFSADQSTISAAQASTNEGLTRYATGFHVSTPKKEATSTESTKAFTVTSVMTTTPEMRTTNKVSSKITTGYYKSSSQPLEEEEEEEDTTSQKPDSLKSTTLFTKSEKVTTSKFATSVPVTGKETSKSTPPQPGDHTSPIDVVDTGSKITTKVATSQSTLEVTSPTVICKPECKWSEWYDVSFPNDDTYGDFETFENIKDTGYEICERPSNIQCRPVDFPEIPLEDLQQNVDCNVSQGLVCRNEEQTGPFAYCYNYEIRILCCSECVPTTGSQSSPETPHEDKTTSYAPNEISTLSNEIATTLTTAGKTDTTKEVDSELTTGFHKITTKPSEKETTSNTSISINTTEVSTSTSAISSTKEKMSELTSSFFNSSTELSQETESSTQIPLSLTTTKGSTGFVEVTSREEATSNIMTTGKMSSSEFLINSVKSTTVAGELSPKASVSAMISTTSTTTAGFISSTSKSSQEESTSQKTISMETSSGLASTVETVTGKPGSSGISSITKPFSANQSTISAAQASTNESLTRYTTGFHVSTPTKEATSTGSTKALTVTSVMTTTPEMSTTNKVSSKITTGYYKSSSQPIEEEEETTSQKPDSLKSTTLFTKSEKVTTSKFATSVPVTEKETSKPTTPQPGYHTSPIDVVGTGSKITTKAATSQSTLEVTSPTVICKPECKWSEWYDVSFPNDDTYGDFETFENIKAIGYEICERPSNIQCRPVDFPEISLEDLQQNVDCNVSQGLVCRNEEQTGPFAYCYNYEIRILCCSECVPTTGSPSSTSFLMSTPETPHEDKTTSYAPNEISTLPNEITTTLTTVGKTDTTKKFDSELTTGFHKMTTKPSEKETTSNTPISLNTNEVSISTSGISSTNEKMSELTSSFFNSSTELSQETESSTQIPLSLTTTKGSTEFVEVTSREEATSNIINTGKMSSSEFLISSVKSTTVAGELSSKASVSDTISTTSTTTAGFIISTSKSSQEESTSQKAIYVETSAGSITSVGTITGRTVSPGVSSTCMPSTTKISSESVDLTSAKASSSQFSTGFHKSTLEISPKIDTTTHKPPSTETTQPSKVTSMKTTIQEVNTTNASSSKLTTGYYEPSTPPIEELSTSKTVSLKSTTLLTENVRVTTSKEATSGLATEKLISTQTTPKLGDYTSPIDVVATGSQITKKVTDSHSTLAVTLPTVNCKPVCQWSQWFDVSFPNDETYGDFETFENIRNSGYKICDNPIDIRCRSTNLPDIPLEDLQQNVYCNISHGLVCQNEEQIGAFAYCYNYKIQILCCSECGPSTGMSSTKDVVISTTSKVLTSTEANTINRISTANPISSRLSTVLHKSTADYSQKEETTDHTTTPNKTTRSGEITSNKSSTFLSINTTKPSTSEGISSYKSTTKSREEIHTPPKTTVMVQTAGHEMTTTMVTAPGMMSTIKEKSTKSTINKSTTESNQGESTSQNPTIKTTESEGNTSTKSSTFGNIRTTVAVSSTSAIRFPSSTVSSKVTESKLTTNLINLQSTSYKSISGKTTEESLVSLSADSSQKTTREHVSKTAPSTTKAEDSFITSKCMCNINGALIQPGKVLYNTTDNAGWCFYARCNESCQVERYTEECHRSTTIASSTKTAKTVTPSTVTVISTKTSISTIEKSTKTSTTRTSTSRTNYTSTPSYECSAVTPPKKVNETWKIDKCTQATCTGANQIATNQMKCPSIENIICANRFQPKKMYDDSGCCYQNECECVCGGWGVAHYITFDGTYYDFSGKCTYVLVQQITPRFDHFRVYIDNFSCDPDDPDCVKTLRIMYKTDTIALFSQNVNKRPFNKVYFNEERVYPALSKNGINIFNSGIFLVVEIPELGSYISFNVLSFTIKIPYNKFFNNTEGHCGKCSNNRIDDCILPNGNLAPSCVQMAIDWGAPDQDPSSCSPIPTRPPTIKSTLHSSASSYFSTLLSSLPSTFSSGRTGSVPSTFLSVRTGSVPSTFSSGHTRSVPSTFSSSRTMSVPSTFSSSRTMSVPSTFSSSRTASMPSTFSSSHKASVPSTVSSSHTGSVPSKVSSSHTGSVPSTFSSSHTGSVPSTFSSSRTASVPSKFSSSRTESVPSTFSSSHTASVPSTFSSSHTASEPGRFSSSHTISSLSHPPSRSSTFSSTLPTTELSTLPSTYPTTVISTGIEEPCNPPDLCKIILSNVFEMCHHVVPPEPFYQACVIDGCTKSEGPIICSNLEVYARLCAIQGVCVNWRNSTQGVCPMDCRSDKVYKACGPPIEPTCNSMYNQEYVDNKQEDFIEGCYCPEGTIRFNTISEQCISSCGCTGPDGMPREPGEMWEINCQICVCNNITRSVQCEAKHCPSSTPATCTEEGSEPVSMPGNANPCCQVTECRCNISLCSSVKNTCGPGFDALPEMPAGGCCPLYRCEPKQVCVQNGTEYQPGDIVLGQNPCEKCICNNAMTDMSGLHIITCNPILCDKQCSEGSEYQEVPGQCCGTCAPTHCVMDLLDYFQNVSTNSTHPPSNFSYLPENSTFSPGGHPYLPGNSSNQPWIYPHPPVQSVYLLIPGEFWSPPEDSCTQYECVMYKDKLIIVASKKTCPRININECIPETIEKDSSGCCLTCVQKPKQCQVTKIQNIILQNGCTSVSPVVMSYCDGHCDSSSMYSTNTQTMENKCSCCQEAQIEIKTISLQCPSGKLMPYSYMNVKSCTCAETRCPTSNRNLEAFIESSSGYEETNDGDTKMVTGSSKAEEDQSTSQGH
ncbi:mucin-5AC-like [Bombina bombina]|uniref:mucin-5AC-like n=1 Tax=Bombina bombina TaxID=8345 RepID=UPI00235AAFEB|nr:mucin-5AC-like [Bombina bombina]